jgi:hypothetical protein
MNETPNDADFEVVFTLVTGQRIASRVTVDDLKHHAEVRPKAEDRAALFDALLANLAYGLENDRSWATTDTSGTTWLFRAGALMAIEINDPTAPVGTRRVGFQVPKSD